MTLVNKEFLASRRDEVDGERIASEATQSRDSMRRLTFIASQSDECDNAFSAPYKQ